jgi:hypothetical protein
MEWLLPGLAVHAPSAGMTVMRHFPYMDGYGQRATLSRQVADTNGTCGVLPPSQVRNMSWRPPLRSSIAPV